MIDIDLLLEKADKCLVLEENELLLVCEKVKDIFANEPNLLRLDLPCSLVGDIHGQFFDLYEMFNVGGPPPWTKYLFMGDYVDRGNHSVETITLLTLLKIKHSGMIWLIRGNHESRYITRTYGFYDEVLKKFGSTRVWEAYGHVFDTLPIASVINNTIFCVHGGLSPCINQVDEIDRIVRIGELPHEGPIADLCWSDPYPEIKGFQISNRGAGYLYGADVVYKFLHNNGLNFVARAHQLCRDGYDLKFNDKLITVWSAPNYCYRMGNLACTMEIYEDETYHYNIFNKSKLSKQTAYDVTVDNKYVEYFY